MLWRGNVDSQVCQIRLNDMSIQIDREDQSRHGKTTMGDKSVETLCHIRLLKANFFRISTMLPTPPSQCWISCL